MYVRREAVLSSEIEGTQASLVDVLKFEVGEGSDERMLDVEEVINYVDAMKYGLARLNTLPLSQRLIREIHRKLMKGVRGQDRDPGEFRKVQVWIGGKGARSPSAATFVPPPPQELPRLLEKFLHDESLPPLIHAGLAHAQFETIHPFMDGNGRMGRLLITFLLCQRRALSSPLLYLSHHFRRHQAEYYDRLQATRIRGDWEQWLRFFLEGVEGVANEATVRAKAIISLRKKWQEVLAGQGRSSGNLHRTLDVLFKQPVITIAKLVEAMEVTFPTAKSLVDRLCKLKALEESTGFRRNRRFEFKPYLALFDDVSAPSTRPGRERMRTSQ